MEIRKFSPPEPISVRHRLEDFDSGEPTLDDWLKERAHSNQANDASRCFVACDDENRVIGYYALASGSIDLQDSPGFFRRNMPDPIPVVFLARMAIDRRFQGHGLGKALFHDSAVRITAAADSIGVKGVVVHAISAEAESFYLQMGFRPSPTNPMTLVVSLASLRKALFQT